MLFIQKCPECKSTDIAHDDKRAEFFCKNCGITFSDALVDEPGSDIYALPSQGGRGVGDLRNVSQSQEGMTTIIRPEDIKKVEDYKLIKTIKRNKFSSAREKSLTMGINEIKRIVSFLSLKRNVLMRANEIYKKSQNEDLIRGRSIEVVAASAVYLSCRLNNVPRTINEITSASKVSNKNLNNMYRLISKDLGIDLNPISPKDFIPRFASNLGLSSKVEIKANEIINELQKRGLTSGRDPKVITAAVLYIASILLSEKRTQKEISEVSGVSGYTIGVRYQEIVKKLGLNL